MPSAPTTRPWPDDGLSDWEITTAHDAVRRFLSTRRELRDEHDDLVQECLLHWLRRRERYDPRRGASPKTFMKRVLDRKLLDLEDERRAAKRGGGARELSLDAEMDGSSLNLGDQLADPGDSEERRLLRMALSTAGARLNRRQRAIVRRLPGSRLEIARGLGITRSTLYEELRRIRDIYRDEGLDAFLH
ncbi:MAG: sigma-70 family RNA polymerase sigma factor [Dehalococcoidia bacterium]